MEERREEMEEKKTYRFGWLPDYPDFRDYTGELEAIKPLLEKTSVTGGGSLPNPSVDLRMWFSPVEDQGGVGSCTANAAVGVVEYSERRAFGKHIDASRLFLYKATRNLMHMTGDTGAYLRTTMQALVLFGVPPEEYWPYTDKKPTDPIVPTHHFDIEPPAFCYAFAQNYQAIKYVRLDPAGIYGAKLLSRIKTYLASGLPSLFGFVVYDSISQASRDGEIPFPCSRERALGGHAIVAVGYDDEKKIKNADCGTETKGALLIRNSWGNGWGDRGYGWLPYEYVLKVLARDFWVLLRQEWVDTGVFK
ncbi:MAG: cysteine protease [Methanosarcinales archaeon]|nr:cysteine protease [Methanosarcinales archaeon]